MLIDINAFVGHWPFMQLKYNRCEILGQRMDHFGTDITVISNLHGIFYKNTQSANEELYEEIKNCHRYRSRFIPFATINPTYAGWAKDMEISIKKLGMKGIRVFPKYHDYDVNHPSLIELIKRARDMDVAVAFTHRIVDSRQRSWMDIDYVAYTPKPEWSLKDIMPAIRAVPDARFLILNVTNGMNVSDEDFELLKKADILFDTSGRSLTNLGKLLPAYGKRKFAFGTHSPVLDYVTGLLRIESLRESEADAATKKLLRGGNASAFLRL